MPEQTEEEKKRDFLKKHGGKTEEEITKETKGAEKAKEQYALDMQTIESNLIGFLDKPEKVLDPEDDTKVIFMMRRPTFEEFKKLLPPEIAEAINNPEVKVTQEKIEEYDKQFFGMVAELITSPKHDAEWWKIHFNSKLAKVIRDEFAKMFSDMGIEMENFQEAHKVI